MSRVLNRAVSAFIGMLFIAACSETLPTAPELESSPSTSVLSNQTAEATSYSGQATVVNADVLVIGKVTLVEAGPLPSSGGQAEATLVEAERPGLLTARALHAATIAQGNRAHSEASIANLKLTVGENTIEASFLSAEAQAECNDDGTATATGSSEIADLRINGGDPIVITGEPNQEVLLPGGLKIIINEQNNSSSGNTGDITVNALHVFVPGVADVVIASAHADISCRQVIVCDQAGDFVTGGGWIVTSGSRANFGVGGGIKHNGFWGHLTYIDHGANLKVKGLGVNGYDMVDANTRIIRGPAEINGVPGHRYEVTVTDDGEPGRGRDRFRIVLAPSGYAAGKELDGGNIQLHKKPSDCDGGGTDPF